MKEFKAIKVHSCASCPFNEHGQAWKDDLRYTYLGYEFYTLPTYGLGGPMLYCEYNPKETLRDNLRGSRHSFKRTIWIAGDIRYKGEFEKQISGFPDWCPFDSAVMLVTAGKKFLETYEMTGVGDDGCG